jgi:hypothetical protein
VTAQDTADKISQNAIYKIVATFLTPVVIGIVGTISISYLGSIKAEVKEVRDTTNRLQETGQVQAIDINTLKGDVRELRGRMDYAVLQEMQSIKRRVEKLEDERASRSR